jgi:hypothetical protein
VAAQLSPAKLEKLSTSADELDNFQPITTRHAGFIPFFFWQDAQIVFDRDTPGIQPELIEQTSHGRSCRSWPTFPIHLNDDSVAHNSPFSGMAL